MHVTNWDTAQKEDAKLDAVLQWLESRKKADLRTLLREGVLSKDGWMIWRNQQNFTTIHGTLYLCSTPKGENEDLLQWLESRKKADLRTLLREGVLSKDGWMIWRNRQNFTTIHGTLYLCSTPKGENEDLLLFMVPKMHQTTALNGCHQDAGHQGCDHTLSLLQEQFWWPGMAKQMRQGSKACRCCLQYEDGTPKAPLCPIVATTPLDLLHVDFTSIETTMELN